MEERGGRVEEREEREVELISLVHSKTCYVSKIKESHEITRGVSTHTLFLWE